VLISGEYQALNARTHRENRGWGKGGLKFLNTVLDLIETGDTVLDYGCGKDNLARELLVVYRHNAHAYDPAVPNFSRRPPADEYDVVISTDVLEHVEPECLDDVLADMAGLLADTGTGYFTIGLVPAVKTLPDGSNAHRIVENAKWWMAKLGEHFPAVVELDVRRTTLEVLVYKSTDVALGLEPGTIEEIIYPDPEDGDA
jgi:hypothetical protein